MAPDEVRVLTTPPVGLCEERGVRLTHDSQGKDTVMLTTAY